MGARDHRPSGDRMVAVIEGQDWLDKPSCKIEHGMTLALNLLGPAGARVRDFLHGRWFGHPLHPMLTDIPAGAWTAGLVLDGMAVLAPGLADWQFTHDNARRVGLVHGTLNTAATDLYCLSWVQRRRGTDHRARWVGAAGWAVMAVSSYLGGSLVYRHRIGEAIRHELRDIGITVTTLMPGPTETEFFDRAGLQDTKLGSSVSKDDPADVARQGFEALMAGKDKVVAGSVKNKVQAGPSKVLPETGRAKMHGSMSEPGSAGS